jgi:two-component system sensor histidine kinase KdpD
VPTPLVLPVALAVLLVLGAVAASARLAPDVETALAAALCCIAAIAAEAAAAPLLALVGWMCASAFARAPYGELRPASADSGRAALAVAGAVAVGAMLGVVRPGSAASQRSTLDGVQRVAVVRTAVDARRRVAAVLVAALALPALTVVLVAARAHLSLADDLLLYLVVVVAVAVLGGLWPAIAAAVAAALLVNWYFTEPLHTFTIAQPDNLLALLLFVVVAVSVSSVVHAAGRQAEVAARSNAEAQTLLELARTVLTEDTPERVLDLLQRTTGLDVALLERVGGGWSTIASTADPTDAPELVMPVGEDLRLVAYGGVGRSHRRVLEAGAGLAAASLERSRLRAQAAQAESLAAGNRMRTALLAAVSHDLRTPLASIKAGITSLQQTDVSWSAADESAFLETIAESTTRLESLIANLLDMSRVQSGAVAPFVAPVSLDEIAPLALRGLRGAEQVRVDVPEDLPLVLTDGGLLERALANLLDNALRWSPVDKPPVLSAVAAADRVRIAVVDFGPGVPARDRDRIFAPFQRLGDQDATTGVGLGLAVARGFVEAVGGSLTASETPGGGLTMSVDLPAATQHAAPGSVVRS